MSIPCSQEETISNMVANFRDMQKDNSSILKSLERMCIAQEKQAAEFREMNMTITAHMIDNREFRVGLERAKEERDVLFKGVRSLQDEDKHTTAIIHNVKIDVARIIQTLENMEDLPDTVKDLTAWKNRMFGGLIIIPSLCTILSLGILIYVTFFR